MNPSPQFRRVANGAARPRIQVALPESVLKQFMRDARKNLRSLSAQAAWIIAGHYANDQDSPSLPPHL